MTNAYLDSLNIGYGSAAPKPASSRCQSITAHSLNGVILLGATAHRVEIQAIATKRLRCSTPAAEAAQMTGLPTGAVRETLARLSGAFSAIGIPDSDRRILVNLSPADLPKAGSTLDLPIAVAILLAQGVIPPIDSVAGELLMFGELGIDGSVQRAGRGAIVLADAASPGQTVICPEANELECSLIRAASRDRSVRGVSSLLEVVAYLQGKIDLEERYYGKVRFASAVSQPVDFSVVRGQAEAIRAATIAAAGAHNLLMIGPPGEGKSLIASAIPGIMPPLTLAERLETTRLWSAAGKLDGNQAVTRRPFRAVSHTVSRSALVGGGSGFPTPGEITLAHKGVLFLDEFAEFNRSTLESLREPMETGESIVSRTGGTERFPSRFSLVAACNPCPCGWHGIGECRCSESAVASYQARLSGPILDRIDLRVTLRQLTDDERFGDAPRTTSADLASIVSAARDRQHERQGFTNAEIPAARVRELCRLDDSAIDKLRSLTTNVSTRAIDRLCRVARTIADLAGQDNVSADHVAEAIQFSGVPTAAKKAELAETQRRRLVSPHIASEAKQAGIDPIALADAVDSLRKLRKQSSGERESAIAAARRQTGLTVGRIAKWEDAGGDCSTWPSLDTDARSLAAEFPSLGIGCPFGDDADDTDYAGALWELLRAEHKTTDADLIRDAIQQLTVPF